MKPYVEQSVPGTIVYKHDWMICGELEFVRIGLATRWMHKMSLFLVSMGQQGLPSALVRGSYP